jgi:hypothetical protein
MHEMCFKDENIEAEYSIAAGSKTTNDIEGEAGDGIIRAYELPSERKVVTNSLTILWQNQGLIS